MMNLIFYKSSLYKFFNKLTFIKAAYASYLMFYNVLKAIGSSL
jgi:hypothetical protein